MTRPVALSAAPDGVLFAVADGGVLRSRDRSVTGEMPLDRWGTLPTGDEATDIDASDALVVRVALRDGTVAVLDRETGTLRERLTLAALRHDGFRNDGRSPSSGTPSMGRLHGRLDLVAVRALPDGSVVGLFAGAEPVVVRWDAARQGSVWATASALPAGAFDLERDGEALVVLGAGARLVWLDRLGSLLAQRIATNNRAPLEAIALGRTEAGIVVIGSGGAWRVDRSGEQGKLVPFPDDLRAIEPLAPYGVAVLMGAGMNRVSARVTPWRVGGSKSIGPERRERAP